MNCNHCNKPLNKAQYRPSLKSCPNCSVNNGTEHVYYPYPDAFGITDKRETIPHPDGPQSYCTPCRSGKEQTGFDPTLCSQI